MSRDGDERKNTNVFVKRGANEQDEIIILNKNDIMKSIPKNALRMPNTNERERDRCTEWRWRIFSIPGRNNEVIEISFKNPNENRMFMDNRGKWINMDDDALKKMENYDKFVVGEYYAYGKN